MLEDKARDDSEGKVEMEMLADKLDTGWEESDADMLTLAVRDKDSEIERTDTDANTEELAGIDTDDDVELSHARSNCQFPSFTRNVAWN